jgi:hypothetical protein
LLESDADRVGNLRLAHLQENPPGANLLPDVAIYGSRPSAVGRRLRHL